MMFDYEYNGTNLGDPRPTNEDRLEDEVRRLREQVRVLRLTVEAFMYKTEHWDHATWIKELKEALARADAVKGGGE